MRLATRRRFVACLPTASTVVMFFAAGSIFASANVASAVPIEDGSIEFTAWAGSSDTTTVETDLFLDETIPRESRPTDTVTAYAEITDGALRMFVDPTGGVGLHDLRASVRDHYTIVGATPGQPVSLTATLQMDGDLATSSVASGTARIVATIAGDFQSDGFPFDPSPYIPNPFGSVGGTFVDQFLNPGETQPFAFELSAPLEGLSVGDSFTLAYSVAMQTVSHMRIDALNTATVSFDLPPGITLQSQNGFGTAVPEPASATIAWAALACLTFTRRRHTR